MGNLSFTSVKGLRPKKNRFNKSYLKAFPSTMGKLVPVHTDFIIPGSWVELKSSLFTRTQALVAPVMDNISTYVHYWKIPIRLIDKKFTKFIGGEINPEEYNPAHFVPAEMFDFYSENFISSYLSKIDSIKKLPFYKDLVGQLGVYSENDVDYPVVANAFLSDNFRNSNLLDLFGYNGTTEFWKNYEGVVNLFEFKAYLLLLKVWYSNENITIHFPTYSSYRGEAYTQVDDSLPEAIEDFLELEGNITQEFSALYCDLMFNFGLKALFNHAWAKDYFTSALPNTQYGEEVTIPLGGSAPVTVNSGQTLAITSENGLNVKNKPEPGSSYPVADDVNITAIQTSPTGTQFSGTLQVTGPGGSTPVATLTGKTASNLSGTVDLSEATAISILELRIAETLQIYKERIMRAGRRYREYLKMFFNVVSSDARLQDPEWLGGGKVALQVGDIEQTSATDSVSPQGNLAGKGTQFGANFAGFKTWCEEWCIIIGVGYMQPKARYCQGIERNKLKTNDLYDWFNPTFERIGEQPIKMAEIYAGSDVSADDIFGYQRRYAEYTFKNDQMHGAFKNSLSFWTAGLRIFDSKPALNQQFIYVQPGVFDRIFAVAEAENDGNVLFWWQHAYYVKQPVSKFGTPGLHLY